MKKQIFTLAFALCVIFGYSQGNSDPWPTTGSVGIGTTTPVAKLDVVKNFITAIGTQKQEVSSFVSSYATNKIKLNINNYLNLNVGGGYFSRIQSVYGTSTNRGFIQFGRESNTNLTQLAAGFGYNSSLLMQLYADGKLQIGEVTTPGDYKLYVEQGILTEKVKVAVKTTGDWADYVFAPDYQLMPLAEVEAFTKENGHLPNVPSADEMVTEGLDVAKMDAKLLEKVEELTLYLIEQQKQIDALKAELEAVKQQKQ